MRRLFLFAVLLTVFVLPAEKPYLSAARDPQIRARENFLAALSETDPGKALELYLAACETAPHSDLYFQKLSSGEFPPKLQLAAGKRLMAIAAQNPSCFRHAALGIHWNRFYGMSRQEKLDFLKPLMEKTPADAPESLLFFTEYLNALRSEGDFSALEKFASVNDENLLLTIADFAFVAHFFEPEKYGDLWQQVLKNLRESEENNSIPLSRLEQFYARIGMYPDALRLYRKLFKLLKFTHNREQLSWEVFLLCGCKKYDEALQLIDSRREKDPAFYNEILQFIRNRQSPPARPEGNSQKLKEFYSAALSGNQPEMLQEAIYVLLVIAEKERDIELYRQARQAAQKAGLDSPELLNSLGYVGVELDQDIPESRKLIEQALLLDPTNTAYLDSLAWAQFKQNKPEEAARTIRLALYSVSPSAESLKILGVIFMHAGDIELARGNRGEALRYYRRALACTEDPELDRKKVQKKIKKLEETGE